MKCLRNHSLCQCWYKAIIATKGGGGVNARVWELVLLVISAANLPIAIPMIWIHYIGLFQSSEYYEYISNHYKLYKFHSINKF